MSTSTSTANSAGLPPMGSGAAELSAENVSAWFGNAQVLGDVTLKMAAGKVTALIGPSGCGKSTFLRVLNRMHELVPGASLAGAVYLGEQDIYATEIGMVFQKANPFPAMTLRDNVLAGLRMTGHKVKNSDDLVELSLRRAGLWQEVHNRLSSPGGALSGGQQQRLCIARALAVSPAILLMDEPCSALDPTSTRRVEETIKEIAADVTVIIVTHNMQQALRVSDRCAFFLSSQGEPGRIVEQGPTEQLFNNPLDPRTSDYVNGRFG